jgi:hypothetical protein
MLCVIEFIRFSEKLLIEQRKSSMPCGSTLSQAKRGYVCPVSLSRYELTFDICECGSPADQTSHEIRNAAQMHAYKCWCSQNELLVALDLCECSSTAGQTFPRKTQKICSRVGKKKKLSASLCEALPEPCQSPARALPEPCQHPASTLPAPL